MPLDVGRFDMVLALLRRFVCSSCSITDVDRHGKMTDNASVLGGPPDYGGSYWESVAGPFPL